MFKKTVSDACTFFANTNECSVDHLHAITGLDSYPFGGYQCRVTGVYTAGRDKRWMVCAIKLLGGKGTRKWKDCMIVPHFMSCIDKD